MNASAPAAYSGRPEQLQHDAACPKRTMAARPSFAPACTCGEGARDPEFWRIVRPQGYVAMLEACAQRRPFTEYVAQLPSRY